MRKIRVIGFTIKKIAEEKNIPVKELASVANCDVNEMNLGLSGRNIFSLEQLNNIANGLGVELDKIIPGDEAMYDMSFVDCMNSFSDKSNMDKVLDIIYDYLDLLDVAENNYHE